MKRLLILGGGESGIGTARLARKHHWKPHIIDRHTLTPARKKILEQLHIPYQENVRHVPDPTAWHAAIASPGIPPTHHWLQTLRTAGVPILGELDFAFPYETAPVIAITGSNGKTTTTLLIGHILNALDVAATVAGNVGYGYARSLVEESTPPQFRIVETSSFQLENLSRFRPRIAILTNISPDHLDRHGTGAAYLDAKLNLFAYQTPRDVAILPADSPEIRTAFTRRGFPSRIRFFSLDAVPDSHAWWQDRTLHIHTPHATLTLPDLHPRIRGPHNRRNIAAATLAVTTALDHIQRTPSPARLKAAIEAFPGVPHRLEHVATDARGIRYYNDSKATNVDAAMQALQAFDRPIVWIVGGTDKGNDYAPLVPLVRQRVRAIIVLGPHREKWDRTFANIVPRHHAESMAEAVACAQRVAQPGDVVLLSPACASFDLFRNFEHRGEAFRHSVRQRLTTP